MIGSPQSAGINVYIRAAERFRRGPQFTGSAAKNDVCGS